MCTIPSVNIFKINNEIIVSKFSNGPVGQLLHRLPIITPRGSTKRT
jgi:hypothetical protein